MDKDKAPGKQNAVIGVVIIVAFVLFFLLLGGQSSRLTCKQARVSGLANCLQQKKLLWVFPMGTYAIDGVSGAQLADSETAEGDPVYRVELITSRGIVPLSSMYTSGYSSKRDVVDQVNAFVQNTDSSALELTEPGLLSMENLICVLIWFPLSYAFSKVGGAVRSLFGRE